MIERIDHLVLTVASLDATCDFYVRCLDLERVDTPDRPTALRFGQQKINVHQVDHTFDPKARQPTTGAADFCLVASAPLTDAVDLLPRPRWQPRRGQQLPLCLELTWTSVQAGV
jgi:catechol 2,3-dioxygenase-like lactoylglutathione lyase family enzyme